MTKSDAVHILAMAWRNAVWNEGAKRNIASNFTNLAFDDGDGYSEAEMYFDVLFDDGQKARYLLTMHEQREDE